MGDFKAFYCAGRVVTQRGDPYAAGPMSRCEALRAPRPLFVTKRSEVLPAPLPGYVIAAFVPLSLLPFPLACALWLAVLLAAVAAAVALFVRLGAGDVWVLWVALSLTLLSVCIPVGELPPIALFGIALCAWAARSRIPWALALGVALTFTEPQIGAAVFVAACALGRRYAIPAIAAAVVLGVLSFAVLGLAGNVEYLRVVLPAHLLSELPSVLQYSLSWVLYRIGATPSIAVLGGRICWIVMLGVAFLYARSAFARSRPEVAFLAAPAFAVVGGPFLHLDHIALAIPAAMWLSTQRPSPVRVAAAVSLAVPVLYVFSIVRFFAVVPFVSGWIGAATTRETIGGLRVALVAVIVLSIIGAIAVAAGTGSIAVAPLVPLPASLPQASWAAYIGKHLVMNGWSIWLVKAPIWFGVVATAAALVQAARRAPAPVL